MSKSIICDICGVKICGDNFESISKTERMQAIYNRNGIKIRLDICPKCVEKLKKEAGIDV